MDWVDLASSCEFSNKPSGSIKRGDFLDLLTNCQLPKNDCSMYKAYSESKCCFAVKKSIKISYKILLLSDSTFFKLFFHIFAAIIDALIVAGHKFLYVVSS